MSEIAFHLRIGKTGEMKNQNEKPEEKGVGLRMLGFN
jgi:hypothetical protein